MVENRGAMKGKKVSSMGFVNILKTRMAKVKLVVSDVLIKVEDTKDSLDEIKFEMRQPRDELKEKLMEELNGVIREALGELAQKNEALNALVKVMHREINKFKGELLSFKATKCGGMPIWSSYRVDVLKPKEFKGTSNAKKVNNFL
ncbi:hypothetical protein J1N35_030268 [Gossypium stocksii]|uniref:Uncharacterized protein n=1 Tax=Gossypium stocksii TaxID=47602 RepID=A0A9D3UZD3_9ROSI|nr:hypothetical protein J1N35_030268 [Gossypium stocksii]